MGEWIQVEGLALGTRPHKRMVKGLTLSFPTKHHIAMGLRVLSSEQKS